MLDILNKKIEQQTSFNQQKRKSLINWFNKQIIEIQIEIFKEQRNQFFALKNQNGLSDTTALVAFYNAIKVFYDKDKLLNQKNKSTNLDSLKEITDFSIKKHRKVKVSLKREKLLNLISVVENLKNNNYSYRQISVYLRKVHKVNASHTYVKKIYEEIQDV